MNQFKHLDTLFPTGANRLCGEVVSVSVTLCFYDHLWSYHFYNGRTPPVISWKRKAWYVNASVNAFHMHRALCKEFRDCPKPDNVTLPDRHVRAVKRLLAAVVMNSYLANYRDGSQYHSYQIDIDVDIGRSPAAWWVVGEGLDDIREICIGAYPIPVVKRPEHTKTRVDVAKVDYAAWSDRLKELDAVKLRAILNGSR